jgi:glycosyltransferase involved in cell wall biosynthesis
MILGRAVVASAVGAVPEMLARDTGRPCGLCVPPKDVPALHAALCTLLEAPEMRREYGLRARARALSEYSMSGIFERYMACWNANRPTAGRRIRNTKRECRETGR